MTQFSDFQPKLQEPINYQDTLPNFKNAYLCALISNLCYKHTVGAKHTDELYRDKVCEQLIQLGLSNEDVKKTIVIDSKQIIRERKNYVISGTQGLIIFYDDTVIIGFRGSEKKPNDWRSNFTFKKAKDQFISGQVHAGFLKAFKALIPENQSNNDVDKIIQKIRSADHIWLTGHSLGGAIASIAASYLLHQGINISGMYTFGAPRIGDAKYRDEINHSLTYKYWRFIHKNDLVPDVPQTKIPLVPSQFLPFGFSREGFMLNLTEEEPKLQLLRIVKPDGSREVLKHYHGFDIADHSMDMYCEYLRNLVISE